MYPKVIEELLHVGPGSLRPSSNGHCSAVWVTLADISYDLALMLAPTIVVGAGASLEDVRSLVVIACYKEANTIRALSISLRTTFG